MIYPAVLAAWTYLAVLYDDPSHTGDPSSAQRLSLYVFSAGFALILLYDGFLRISDRWERRSPGVAYDRASDQATQRPDIRYLHRLSPHLSSSWLGGLTLNRPGLVENFLT